jgi:hypothetical protein
MAYEVTITHAAANHSVSAEYRARTLKANEPEQAADLFLIEADHPKGFNPNDLVIGLADGKSFKHEDESGKKVEVKPAEVGQRCVRCTSPYQGTPGWQKTTAGFLCPDCTVAVCPEDAEPVGKAVA